jgi:sortase A
MKKLSYFLIIAGILMIFFPIGREWIDDWEQARLLNHMETAVSTADGDKQGDHLNLMNSLAHLNQLLEEGEDSEESAESPSVSPAGDEDKLLEDQKALGILTIPKIDVKLPILEGATKKNMRYAATHLTETAPLGHNGNAAIAAHRAHTKGRLFNRLNEVTIGDSIELKLRNGETQAYTVYKISIVEPTEVSVLEGSDKERTLTLITCDPLIHPTHRLIVKARADTPASNSLTALPSE